MKPIFRRPRPPESAAEHMAAFARDRQEVPDRDTLELMMAATARHMNEDNEPAAPPRKARRRHAAAAKGKALRTVQVDRIGRFPSPPWEPR